MTNTVGPPPESAVSLESVIAKNLDRAELATRGHYAMAAKFQRQDTFATCLAVFAAVLLTGFSAYGLGHREAWWIPHATLICSAGVSVTTLMQRVLKWGDKWRHNKADGTDFAAALRDLEVIKAGTLSRDEIVKWIDRFAQLEQGERESISDAVRRREKKKLLKEKQDRP